MKQHLRTISKGLLACMALVIFSCDKNQDENQGTQNITTNNTVIQSDGLETVSLEKSLDYFKELNTKQLTGKNLDDDDIDLKIDLASLEQIDITDTDAKLNIADATTKFPGVQTEILQIEIDGTLQTVLLHRIAESKDRTANRAPVDTNFSGDVYSTDVRGNVQSGYRVTNGDVTDRYDYVRGAYSIDPPVKLREVIIPGYKPILPPTNDIGTRMDYQFVRSQNNGSTMGLAYYAALVKRAAQKIDDEIFADALPDCLKKILKNLKGTAAGPGNMITQFSGNTSSGYNWTMDKGKNDLGVPGNTISTYNATTGITTIFDIKQFPDATDLSWARTMMHESIHAYLTSYYKLNAPGYIADYPVLFEDWCANGNKNLNKYQHEEIARGLVTSFGWALETYGISQGYKLPRQFYEDMAWGGLLDSDAFNSLPEADRKRISNTVNIELYGVDDLGNKKPQKGKKAGC